MTHYRWLLPTTLGDRDKKVFHTIHPDADCGPSDFIFNSPEEAAKFISDGALTEGWIDDTTAKEWIKAAGDWILVKVTEVIIDNPFALTPPELDEDEQRVALEYKEIHGE